MENPIRANENRKELPLIEPIYATFNSQGSATAVLAKNPGIRNWYYNKVMNLTCSLKFLSGFTTPELDIVGSTWNDNPFVEKKVFSMQYESEQINRIIKDLIDDGYYVVFVGIDDFFVEGKSWYQERHFNHDGLICGYDLQDDMFCIYAYDDNWIYRKFWTPAEGFNTGRISTYNSGLLGYLCGIKPLDTRVEFSAKNAVEGIKEYLRQDDKLQMLEGGGDEPAGGDARDGSNAANAGSFAKNNNSTDRKRSVTNDGNSVTIGGISNADNNIDSINDKRSNADNGSDDTDGGSNKTAGTYGDVNGNSEGTNIHSGESAETDTDKEKNAVYGISVQKFIAEYVSMLYFGKIPYSRMDRRVFRMIWEHKNVMLQRIKMIEKALYLTGVTSEKYSRIEREANNLRLLYAAHLMKRRDSVLPFIKSKLLKLSEEENAILTEFVAKAGEAAE